MDCKYESQNESYPYFFFSIDTSFLVVREYFIVTNATDFLSTRR